MEVLLILFWTLFFQTAIYFFPFYFPYVKFVYRYIKSIITRNPRDKPKWQELLFRAHNPTVVIADEVEVQTTRPTVSNVPSSQLTIMNDNLTPEQFAQLGEIDQIKYITFSVMVSFFDKLEPLLKQLVPKNNHSKKQRKIRKDQ